MFRLIVSKRLCISYNRRPFSSPSILKDVHNILDTHLKIDKAGMETISKLKLDSVIATIPKNQLIQNCTVIQKMDVTLDKINFLAPCLMLQPAVMKNRIVILKEMGVKSVDLQHIHKFPSSMRKTLKNFKLYYDIPQDQDIMVTVLGNIPGIPLNDIKHKIAEFKQKTSMGAHYQLYLSYYKEFHLKLNPKLCKKNRKWKYQSITEIAKLVHVLKTKCHFDEEFIRRKPQLLKLDVDSVLQFLDEFKDFKVSGQTIIDIIKRRPNMLFYDRDNTRELLQILKILGISENSLFNYISALGMNKRIFLSRYIGIANNDILGLWIQHPRLINLICKYNSVKNRAEYLKPLNCVNNANIQTYLSTKKYFMRFVEGDVERTINRKYFVYVLQKELGEDAADLMHSIKKHSFWKHVPLLQVEKTIQYLKQCFTVEDICSNIQIVLYPRSQIMQVLDTMKTSELSEMEQNLTPKQCLALCLYKIEKKYHFSGDGVWQTTNIETSDSNANLLKDTEENETDKLIKRVNANDNELLNISGAIWLEYLLR